MAPSEEQPIIVSAAVAVSLSVVLVVVIVLAGAVLLLDAFSR